MKLRQRGKPVSVRPPRRPRNLKDFQQMYPRDKVKRATALQAEIQKLSGTKRRFLFYNQYNAKQQLTGLKATSQSPESEVQTRFRTHIKRIIQQDREKKALLRKTVEQIERWGAKDTPQDHVQIFFPLSTAATAGEFAKGILQVLAPGTRVTFLATAPTGLYQKAEKQILVKSIQKSVQPNTTCVRIADDFFSGITLNAITSALRASGYAGKIEPKGKWKTEYTVLQKSAYPIESIKFDDEGLDITPLHEFLRGFWPKNARVNLGWKKTWKNLGIAMDPDNAQKWVQKHATTAEESKSLLYDRYETSVPITTKQWKFLRRYFYHLGIATARTYLEILNKRKSALSP